MLHVKHEDAQSVFNDWQKQCLQAARNLGAVAAGRRLGRYSSEASVEYGEPALNASVGIVISNVSQSEIDAELVQMLRARIATLEAERHAAYRTIAELSRRPTLEYVAELEAEIARLKIAQAPKDESLIVTAHEGYVYWGFPAKTQPVPVARPSIPARALRFSA